MMPNMEWLSGQKTGNDTKAYHADDTQRHKVDREASQFPVQAEISASTSAIQP